MAINSVVAHDVTKYFVWEADTPESQLKPLYPIEFGTHMDGGRIDIDGIVQMWGHASSVASDETVEEHPLPMTVLDNKYNATLQKLAYSQISQVGDVELISQVVDSQNYFTVKQGLQTNTHLRYFTVSPITEAPNFFHFAIVGAHV